MMELHERAPQFFRILVAMIILATIATALRVYVRIKIVKSFGKDDYLMVAALLCFIMFTTCALGGIRYGTGQHMSELTPENSMKALRYWWLCYAAYTSTMMLAKTSIGFFLLRVTIERVYIWIIYAAMTLTGITGVVFCFVTVLQCRPVSFFWTKAVDATTGTCLDIDIIIALTYFYSAVSALCDFTFGLLPVVMLWNLNMSRSTKIAVAPILSMACIASAGVLVRTAYVRDFRDPDFLYSTVDIAIWSDIEEGLAITAGSLACLRPLFRIFRARLLGIGGSSSSGDRGRRQWPRSASSSQQPMSIGRARKGSLGRPWSELLEETRQTVDAEERGVLGVVGKGGGGFEMGEAEVGVKSVSSRGTLR
ncbi:putative integral membrane [Diplodia seriata]|uniref:Putative integral membrane n=1 Tax=Diplodia seriata TaxID=420778 RepID=A0A0G2FV02_9PEZI|nr:putative integral membrane [Diplodia seriata]